MAPKSDDSSTDAVAERLLLLRAALDLNQAAIGRLAKITPKSWNNYESGLRRISLNQAILVCAATGVTLDWIYRGDLRGVPMELATKLQAAQPAGKTRRKRA